ncbi:gamma-glutamyl-gamma-aminobutyrate hydrolase family protein [Pseudonocardia abyssalis]|uniref:Gamma-glutamyl-gamma-aminobutyrate hydrolase family protein n=1 Tax=Pseudonocardia abyssalis TaxID=2792008 RepID=A0ABS6US81_9PSEU|nr:gamma-glutamyl-gamma-aminobutyrate hydrolase family protein [Pseudonocardia abyssalis]MBW0113728.1 gamma-glutamyl-gamma-aminobutyrate hydrolase family protein [Pseudonocardia abyssalis]MBW0134801.1 gamma-glutamyl-gamma-aminobutyrate hydrolase family protein [Pseudonocardia abyssalis]
MQEPGSRGAPLIAVTGRRRPAHGVHTGPAMLDSLHLDVYFTGYAEHVGAAGGIAVYVPSTTDPEALLDRVDGLILSGGADVDPIRYGAARCSTTPELDPERDATELALLDAALARELPVLAICRGLQLVNVSRGGTLHAHLDEHQVGPWHEVLIEPGSMLGGLHGATTSVNSLHHQSIDRLGDDLVVTGRALDGIVEAVELPGSRLLGVQWHPEQLAGPQPVFDWLVDGARERSAIR